VRQFPALQVVLLDEKLAYEVQRDDSMKGLSLPYWQAEDLLVARRTRPADERDAVFRGLIAQFQKVRMAQVRIDQRLALLRCVEALRLYAAGHGGRLPAQLADVPVPVPHDPVTGKPFRYKLDGDTATVRGSPPRGMEKVALYNVRYEVTVATAREQGTGSAPRTAPTKAQKKAPSDRKAIQGVWTIADG
jgi:hypothetical protein